VIKEHRELGQGSSQGGSLDFIHHHSVCAASLDICKIILLDLEDLDPLICQDRPQ